MSNRNGQLEKVNEGNGDMVCRTIVAAIAAMIALRLCQFIKNVIDNAGLR